MDAPLEAKGAAGTWADETAGVPMRSVGARAEGAAGAAWALIVTAVRGPETVGALIVDAPLEGVGALAAVDAPLEVRAVAGTSKGEAEGTSTVDAPLETGGAV